MRIYLGGPIQHLDDDGEAWRELIKEHSWYDDHHWVDPLDVYNNGYGDWSDKRIVEKDLELIDSADALLVNWELVPTAGTPMEIFYASRMKDIPVHLVYRGDPDDLSPWIRNHATVFEWFDVAIEAFVNYD